MKQEKWMQYAAQINDKMVELLQDEIDIESKDFDATQFFHALATACPTMLYNKLTNNSVEMLEFNHIANRMCFQFQTKQNKGLINKL